MARPNPARIAGGKIAAVDAYIGTTASFAQPILEYLRGVIHEGAPDVQEAMKWSRPFFLYRGVILGNIAAFKEHCSFGLWGAEIADILRTGGVASGEAMGTFGRITSVRDLPARSKLVSYVRRAAKPIDDGTRTKAWERPKVAKPAMEVPEALTVALRKNKAAAKQFDAMSPGCRREYAEWIAGAKREDTSARRVALAIEWIGEGKSRNWKYEKHA